MDVPWASPKRRRGSKIGCASEKKSIPGILFFSEAQPIFDAVAMPWPCREQWESKMRTVEIPYGISTTRLRHRDRI